MRTTTAEGTAIAAAGTVLRNMISTRTSVEIESRSRYLFGDRIEAGTTVGRTVSLVCVMIIEVGVPDTSVTEKVTTSKVLVNEDVVSETPAGNSTPVTLAAKADAGWS
jgi:hypothetical protein